MVISRLNKFTLQKIPVILDKISFYKFITYPPPVLQPRIFVHFTHVVWGGVGWGGVGWERGITLPYRWFKTPKFVSNENLIQLQIQSEKVRLCTSLKYSFNHHKRICKKVARLFLRREKREREIKLKEREIRREKVIFYFFLFFSLWNKKVSLILSTKLILRHLKH